MLICTCKIVKETWLWLFRRFTSTTIGIIGGRNAKNAFSILPMCIRKRRCIVHQGNQTGGGGGQEACLLIHGTMKTNVLSTNAHSSFPSQGIVGPQCLEQHTWRSPSISGVLEIMHEASLGPLKGAVSAQKALQGWTRELLEGDWRAVALQANQLFFLNLTAAFCEKSVPEATGDRTMHAKGPLKCTLLS